MGLNEEKYSNKSISHLLKSIAAAYLLKNENRFKVLAYQRAAETVEHLTRELKDIWEDGRLEQISSIGPSIADHLDQYFTQGRSKHFDTILNQFPSSLFELLKIPGIGPKKAYKLVKILKLFDKTTVVEGLKKACLTHQVARIPGFGEKSEEEILQAIELYQKKIRQRERMPLPYAYNLANEIINYLKTIKKIERIDALGSLRRMVATIGDIDIAIQTKEFRSESDKEIIKHFIRFPKVIKVINAGEKKASIIVKPNIQVDLRIQPAESYGSMLQYFTGSKEHNINLREYAIKKGYSLSEYGIKKINQPKKTHKVKKFSQETDFYQFLGLQFIPPEIREGTNEIELASKNKIPSLLNTDEVKGDLHLHSNFDLHTSHDVGSSSFEEFVSQALKLKYQYIGFADHNPSISSNTENEIYSILKRRKEVIDKFFSVKKIDRIKYFIGLEVDILSDGNLALPAKAFSLLDYLIVSVHSVFNLDKKTMTKRILKALSYPKVKILGHPTGRLLNRREGYELEWPAIFNLCRSKKIALEINAWPERLDLPDVLVREAVNQQIKLVINTDSHHAEQMTNMIYGVAVARRGWAKKDDIINTLTYNKIKHWIGA